MTEAELELKSQRLREYDAKVLEFFKGDEEKAHLWFSTPNPQLGGVSPDAMIFLDRDEKLYQFIDNELEGFHE